jgi:agmatine deiminase
VGAPPALLAEATQRLADVAGVSVFAVEQDDSWVRDSGPTFVVNRATREVRGVHWNFNAWGGELGGVYADCRRDQTVGRRVLELAGKRRYRCPLVMEGGSIHVDGEGTLLTTEECLLNKNRNPQCSREDIELELRRYLGVSKIIWLPRGVHGDDDTNGHVDNLVAFVRPAEVVLTWTENKTDPQYAISQETFRILSEARDAKGRRFVIHKLPQPSPQVVTEAEVKGLTGALRQAGKRLPASYVNFYIGNGCVIVPGFNDVNDVPAQARLQKLFPDRVVVMVSCGREILLGGGNIHCITQQEPA